MERSEARKVLAEVRRSGTPQLIPDYSWDKSSALPAGQSTCNSDLPQLWQSEKCEVTTAVPGLGSCQRRDVPRPRSLTRTSTRELGGLLNYLLNLWQLFRVHFPTTNNTLHSFYRYIPALAIVECNGFLLIDD
ncbi:hypothetical protein J6590_030470 [Homalodisca vitripennis]|nr:hypothetical protein J6590_030470 [Homalodisca vitripennis]